MHAGLLLHVSLCQNLGVWMSAPPYMTFMQHAEVHLSLNKRRETHLHAWHSMHQLNVVENVDQDTVRLLTCLHHILQCTILVLHFCPYLFLTSRTNAVRLRRP